MNSIAVIGAGLTGATACRALREHGFDGKIYLFGDEPYEPYDRPSLSKAALLNKTDPPLLMCDNWAGDFRIEKCLGVRVDAFDLPSMRLDFDSGSELLVDKVLFATGSRARSLHFGHSSEVLGLFTLRTHDDCVALQNAIFPGARVVIIGGGLIGCELASTIQEMGAQAIILETADELLLRVLGRAVGSWCREKLQERGVEVQLGISIEKLDFGPSFQRVLCADGREFEGDLAVVSIGAEPVADLAAVAGLHCAQGITVSSVGMTSNENVFAAGDVANWPLRTGGRRSLETYLNSQSQATTVAAAMLGKALPAPQVPLSWTEIAGHRIQMMGDVIGPGEVVTRAKDDSGAMFCRINDGKLQSIVSIDRPSEFAFASKLLEREMVVTTESIRDPLIRMKDIFKAAAKSVTK